MIWTTNNTWKEEGTKTVELECGNCGNTKENFVVGAFDGFNLGFVFVPKKNHIGKKAYYLVCPVCDNANKKLTLDELDSLRF